MATFVHFDMAADDLERAKRFYEKIFDWQFETLPGPMNYLLIHTKGMDGKEGLGGGMAKREVLTQGITNFIGVKSVDETCKKIEEMGGKIIEPKKAVPGWGHLAVFQDTENNTFGIWENE